LRELTKVEFSPAHLRGERHHRDDSWTHSQATLVRARAAKSLPPFTAALQLPRCPLATATGELLVTTEPVV
jgi:hypothetical protein